MADAFDQLDRDKLKEEIKKETVKEAQAAMIAKLTGDKPSYSWEAKGKAAPESYDELFSEVDKRIPKLSQEDIDKRVEEKFKEREERTLKQQEEERKKTFETQKQYRERQDKQWYELVQAKKIPAPAPEIQEAINKGEKLDPKVFETDPGMKAWKELNSMAVNLGKDLKLAYYEDYDAKPAGASAPVLGGRPSASQAQSEELDYDEVAKTRKKWFGF